MAYIIQSLRCSYSQAFQSFRCCGCGYNNIVLLEFCLLPESLCFPLRWSRCHESRCDYEESGFAPVLRRRCDKRLGNRHKLSCINQSRIVWVTFAGFHCEFYIHWRKFAKFVVKVEIVIPLILNIHTAKFIWLW